MNRILINELNDLFELFKKEYDLMDSEDLTFQDFLVFIENNATKKEEAP